MSSTRKIDTAAPLVPPHATVPELRQAASGCQACPLWERGTQTVFGEGDPRAAVMLVGEQPGDREDREGRPFVGPAGRLLDEALAAAGIDREHVYITNVVKHFKWEPRGKRRIHSKPNAAEIRACSPWLHAEIAVIEPAVIVCLGATAAQALLGRDFRVTRDGGRLVPTAFGPRALATLHPAAVLRAPDEASRREGTARLIADLSVVAGALRRAA